jgi:hypothetical protein
MYMSVTCTYKDINICTCMYLVHTLGKTHVHVCTSMYIYVHVHRMYIHVYTCTYFHKHVHTCLYHVQSLMYRFADSCPCGQDSRCRAEVLRLGASLLRAGQCPRMEPPHRFPARRPRCEPVAAFKFIAAGPAAHTRATRRSDSRRRSRTPALTAGREPAVVATAGGEQADGGATTSPRGRRKRYDPHACLCLPLPGLPSSLESRDMAITSSPRPLLFSRHDGARPWSQIRGICVYYSSL